MSCGYACSRLVLDTEEGEEEDPPPPPPAQPSLPPLQRVRLTIPRGNNEFL